MFTKFMDFSRLRWAALVLSFFFSMLVSPASATPRTTGGANTITGAFITFSAGDTSDSDAVPVNNICSARAVVVSGDVLELRAVTTPGQTAASGTLLATFTTSSTAPTVFTAGTLYVKARATTATNGGDLIVVNCSTQIVSSGYRNTVRMSDFAAGSSTFGLQEAINYVCLLNSLVAGQVIEVAAGRYDFGTSTITTPASCEAPLIRGQGQSADNDGYVIGTEFISNHSGGGFSFITFNGSTQFGGLERISIKLKVPQATSVGVDVNAGTGFFTMRDTAVTATDVNLSPTGYSVGTGVRITDPVYLHVSAHYTSGFGVGMQILGTSASGGAVIERSRFSSGGTTGIGLLLGGVTIADLPLQSLALIGNVFEGNNIGVKLNNANAGGGAINILHVSSTGNWFENGSGSSTIDVWAIGHNAWASQGNQYIGLATKSFKRDSWLGVGVVRDSFSGDVIYSDIQMIAGSCSVSQLVAKKATTDLTACTDRDVFAEKYWFPAAYCNNITPVARYDTPTANAPVLACITGTNTQKGVFDFDPTTNQSAQITQMLPTDWTGAVDVKIKWLAAATTGDTVWTFQTACAADGATDDPTFNTASSITDTAKGTTLQTNDAAATGVVTTGCTAGALMHLKIGRDAANGADTMAGNARLIGFEVTLRRSV